MHIAAQVVVILQINMGFEGSMQVNGLD